MAATLKREDRIGLAVAFGLHAALVIVFLMQPETRADIAPNERMTVNLASEVGLEASAPEPVTESRAATAPVLAPIPAPALDTAPLSPPPVQPRPVQSVAATRPTPADTRSRRRPDKSVIAAVPAKPAAKGGGNRVSDNFLSGMGDSNRTSETRTPTSSIGASEKASLFQAVARQIREHNQRLSGPDIDLLVTKVRFRLNPDGSLSGAPQVVSQRGLNDINRTQAHRHAEQAVRAVRLAAPFDLPEKYYDAWKSVTVDFDWNLAK